MIRKRRFAFIEVLCSIAISLGSICVRLAERLYINVRAFQAGLKVNISIKGHRRENLNEGHYHQWT